MMHLTDDEERELNEMIEERKLYWAHQELNTKVARLCGWDDYSDHPDMPDFTKNPFHYRGPIDTGEKLGWRWSAISSGFDTFVGPNKIGSGLRFTFYDGCKIEHNHAFTATDNKFGVAVCKAFILCMEEWIRNFG